MFILIQETIEFDKARQRWTIFLCMSDNAACIEGFVCASMEFTYFSRGGHSSNRPKINPASKVSHDLPDGRIVGVDGDLTLT